ncbi:MAG: hypothetical protein HUU03_08245 [Planctomycetaceae bacterium]|nr:hypothetical protein [Planctomycetaceae bacterium]
MVRVALVMLGLTLALVALWAPGRAQPSPRPAAPLARFDGTQVHLAWRLPAGPGLERVIIYRRQEGQSFGEVAQVEAEALAWSDSAVSTGQTWEYCLAFRAPTGSLSEKSAPVTVTTGATQRLRFRGGSMTRGIFEISSFVQGRRYDETFVHAAGEEIGDLRRVEGQSAPLDFRLGIKLVALRVETAAPQGRTREVLLDERGQPLKHLGGAKLELALPIKGELRERVVAELEAKDGRRFTLIEGEGLAP